MKWCALDRELSAETTKIVFIFTKTSVEQERCRIHRGFIDLVAKWTFPALQNLETFTFSVRNLMYVQMC